MWGISWIAEELLASLEELFYTQLVGLLFICGCHWMFMWCIAWRWEFCKTWGVMMAIPKIRLVFFYYTVTGQIVPMFQKIIVPLKHREMCAQWYSITSQKLLMFRWKEFYFGTSVLLGCCVSSCLHAGVTSGRIYKWDLIYMLRCQSVSSKRAEYWSLCWYNSGWDRERCILWESTEGWSWYHRLLSIHVLQSSVLLAWHTR